jgi:hypothetical protein
MKSAAGYAGRKTMDISSKIESKVKKKNRLLFSRDSECLQELIRLIEEQKHRTLVLWALDCANVPLLSFEAKYPKELRPRKTLELCEAWGKGVIRMPEAKKAILNVHAAAKEIDDREFIALAHAIGHAGATVHVETHALGLVFYELTAIVFRETPDKCDTAVEEKIRYYIERLKYYQSNTDTLNGKWAVFLSDDTRPNKEKLQNEKRRAAHRKFLGQ